MTEMKVCTHCSMPASSPTAQFCRGCGSKLETVSAEPRETKTSVPIVSGSGTPDVQKMEEMKDVEELIKALGYEENSDIRRAAAVALGRIGDNRAVEPLKKALNDSFWGVRDGAADALKKIGDRSH